VSSEDNIIFRDIYKNAYYVLIGKLCIDDLLEYNGCVLPFQPYTAKEEIKEEVYDEIINHFISTEEYEKCAKIKKIKDSIYNKKNS
jgi:hypothetical protein